MERCQHCNKSIPEGGNFCKYCGARVNREKHVASTPKEEPEKEEITPETTVEEIKEKPGEEKKQEEPVTALGKKRKKLMQQVRKGWEYAKERDWAVFLGLFLFSFILRYALRADCLFHADVVGYAFAAERTLETGQMHYGLVPGYPGAIFIITIFFAIAKVFGAVNAEGAAIISMLLFASLAVGFMYLFLREWIRNKYVSFTASVLFSLTPIFLSASTYGKDHGPSAMFILLTAYLAALYHRKRSDKLCVALGLSFGYAISVRLTNVFFLFPLLFLFFRIRYHDGWHSDITKRAIKELVYIGASAFVIIALFYRRFYIESGVQPFLDQMNYNRFLGVFHPTIYTGLDWLTRSLVEYGWVGVILGVIYLYRKKKYDWIILLTIWFVPFFVYLSNRTTSSPRYFVIALIPLMILIGFGLEWIKEIKVFKHKAAVASILLFLLLCGSFVYLVYPIMKFRHNYCGPNEFR